jgi:hypothetical protein
VIGDDGFMMMVMEKTTKVWKEIFTLQYRLFKKNRYHDWRKDFYTPHYCKEN